MADRTVEERLNDLETLVVNLMDLVVLDMSSDGTLSHLDAIGQQRLESLIELRQDIGRDLAERNLGPTAAAADGS